MKEEKYKPFFGKKFVEMMALSSGKERKEKIADTNRALHIIFEKKDNAERQTRLVQEVAFIYTRGHKDRRNALRNFMEERFRV